MNSGISLAHHFGEGDLSAEDVASGILGAIVKGDGVEKSDGMERCVSSL